MEVPNTWAPLLISAVKDALTYHEQLFRSETLRNREDYEEHLLQLSQFFGSSGESVVVKSVGSSHEDSRVHGNREPRSPISEA